MKHYIVSYYQSTNKIHNFYDSLEEAKKAVRMCNIFSNGREKLSIGTIELTDEEYREYCGGETENDI